MLAISKFIFIFAFTYQPANHIEMPTVLFIFGIRFFFYPNDHEPIHVHIEYQGHSAKIRVSPDIALIENNGLKPQTIKKAIDTVTFYRDDIIAEWHRVFD